MGLPNKTSPDGLWLLVASGRRENSAPWPPARRRKRAGAKVAAGYSSLGLRGLEPTGFCEVAGLILSGAPALTGATAGSGSLK